MLRMAIFLSALTINVTGWADTPIGGTRPKGDYSTFEKRVLVDLFAFDGSKDQYNKVSDCIANIMENGKLESPKYRETSAILHNPIQAYNTPDDKEIFVVDKEYWQSLPDEAKSATLFLFCQQRRR